MGGRKYSEIRKKPKINRKIPQIKQKRNKKVTLSKIDRVTFFQKLWEYFKVHFRLYVYTLSIQKRKEDEIQMTVPLRWMAEV